MLKLAGELIDELLEKERGYCISQDYCLHKEDNRCNIKPFVCIYFRLEEDKYAITTDITIK